ncbi:MAG: ATP-dependent helicase [Clostridia bacterium]|nr:ATP-dependent helicase [Clostridia bacterium]
MDFIQHIKENFNIHLNEQQQKAVLTIDGPILLLAVPGGGKTTVIVSRCANMVLNHNIKPQNILTLTFSKASARDMEQRFEKVFGSEAAKGMHFSTIHSFCYSVLRTYSNRMRIPFPTIIEDEKAPITKTQLLKQLYLKYNEAYINDDKLEELSNAICYVKNMLLTKDQIEKLKNGIKNFSEIFKGYENTKRENNFIDYDDMLTRTLYLFGKNGELLEAYRKQYTHINVDESQDTSYLQHEIIRCLANPRNNIFMVGDEDQSIYTFRAAFPKALLNFSETYPGARVLLMERNYRSTKSIVHAADRFIKQNNERYDKNMFSEKDEGTPINLTCHDERNDQYTGIAAILKREGSYSETAVLYRNNISAIPLADILERNHIPFYLREAKTYFFKHWVTTDITAFFSLASDSTDREAFRQVYFKMNAYLSKAMVEYLDSQVKTTRSIFDVLMEFPDLNPMTRRKLLDLRQNFIKLSRRKPLDAIELIESELGYGEYLNRMSNEGSYSLDNLTQMLSSLKSIAANTESLESFKSRLLQLQMLMENAKYSKGRNVVTLSTIHSSKGLEFDRVFIIDLYDSQFPSANSISEFDKGNKSLMEEEVRLFYVGATRARHTLELVTSNKLDGRSVKSSRFIKQLLSVYKKTTEELDPDKLGIDLNKYSLRGITSMQDLSIDLAVVHKKFGVGNIRFMNPKHDLLEILFADSGLRTLSLKTCLSGNFIYTLDEASPKT